MYSRPGHGCFKTNERKLQINVCQNSQSSGKAITEKNGSLLNNRHAGKMVFRIPWKNITGGQFTFLLFMSWFWTWILVFLKKNLRFLHVYSFMPENIIKLDHKGVQKSVTPSTITAWQSACLTLRILTPAYRLLWVRRLLISWFNSRMWALYKSRVYAYGMYLMFTAIV